MIHTGCGFMTDSAEATAFCRSATVGVHLMVMDTGAIFGICGFRHIFITSRRQPIKIRRSEPFVPVRIFRRKTPIAGWKLRPMKRFREIFLRHQFIVMIPRQYLTAVRSSRRAARHRNENLHRFWSRRLPDRAKAITKILPIN